MGLSTQDVSDEDLVGRFPTDQVTRENAAQFRGRLRRELLVSRCSACRRWHQPPRAVCPNCWSEEVVPTPVAGTGTVWLTVFLHQGPPADGVDYSTPYPVVTIELPEQPGLRVTSTVVGAPNEAIVIGAPVTLDWAERSGSPLPVWRLAETDR